MKKLILIAMLMVPATVYAQQLPMPTNPPDQTVKFEVTVQDLNLIGEGLGSLPFSRVAPLMNKLQAQINAQQQQAKPKEPEGK